MNRNQPSLSDAMRPKYDYARIDQGGSMINYRRFERRRLLTIQAGGFHTNSSPVSVKHFQVPKANAETMKSPGRPTAPIRVKPYPVHAAIEMAAHSVA